MKDTFRIIIMAMLAIVLAGCGKDPQPEPEPEPEPEKPALNQNLTFTLEVAEVGANTAKINVSHNGSSDDTWYCFTTDNQNVNEAINDKYTELISAPSISGLKKQKTLTAVLTDLEPETAYKFIAFGISEDGELYGKASSIDFKTVKGEVVMEANKAWKVAYTGVGKINNQEYKHTITVTSTDKNKYFITGYDKASFEAYDIKEIAKEELNYLKRWIKEYNSSNGTNLTLDQMLFEGDGIDALNFTPGEWYAIAIGVDDEGEISGLYSVSDLITIEEEEPTEAYASWLGDWTWTGANGVAWDISFEKGLSNISYYLTGWEDGYGPEIPVEWDPEMEMWVIYTYNYGEYDFGNGMKGEVYILGTDETYIYPLEGLPICAGMVEEDGTRVCFGYSEETEDGVVTISYMQYIAAISGTYYTLSETTEWPTFPITITPASKVTKSTDSQTESVQKFTKAPKTFKTYYKSYCEAVK